MDSFRTDFGQSADEAAKSAEDVARPAEDAATGDALYNEVRRALRHLYDPVYMRQTPLVEMLRAAGVPLGMGEESAALRKLLIEAIDLLAPGDNVPFRSDERRVYAAVRGRYVDQLSMEELADQLGLSDRQVRRELRAGTEAVVEMLATRLILRGQDPDAAHRGQENGPVLAEIRDLSLEREPVNLCAAARGVEALVASLAQQRGVVVDDKLDVETVMVEANRILLRQALIEIYAAAIQHPMGASLSARVRCEEWVAAISLGPVQEPSTWLVAERPIVPPDLLQALGAEVAYVEVGRALELRLRCMPTQTVLLIDDNRSLHLLLARYLSGQPYALLNAYDVPTGLALARAEQPDVIILDIMMPDQDGWDGLHALKQAPETRAIPIIVCSVLDQEPLARSLEAAGYLKKPVNQAALLGVLRSVARGGS